MAAVPKMSHGAEAERGGRWATGPGREGRGSAWLSSTTTVGRAPPGPQGVASASDLLVSPWGAPEKPGPRLGPRGLCGPGLTHGRRLGFSRPLPKSSVVRPWQKPGSLLAPPRVRGLRLELPHSWPLSQGENVPERERSPTLIPLPGCPARHLAISLGGPGTTPSGAQGWLPAL